MNIVLDENGNTVNVLQERIDELREKLKPLYDKLLVEKAENEERKKPLNLRWGYRLASKMSCILRQNGIRKTYEIPDITYETIFEHFTAYMELVAEYNEHFDFPANKQDFCALLQITERTYNNLCKHEDDEIKLLMESINDYLNGLGFHAGEGGNLNDRATMSRLKIREAGQGLVENDATITILDKTEKESPLELQNQLNRLLGTAVQQIENGIKNKKRGNNS